MVLLPIDDEILHAARRLDPRTLRSLDAIHLATALSLRDDVDVLFTYDARLTEAAAGAGLRVLSPGAA